MLRHDSDLQYKIHHTFPSLSFFRTNSDRKTSEQCNTKSRLTTSTAVFVPGLRDGTPGVYHANDGSHYQETDLDLRIDHGFQLPLCSVRSSISLHAQFKSLLIGIISGKRWSRGAYLVDTANRRTLGWVAPRCLKLICDWGWMSLIIHSLHMKSTTYHSWKCHVLLELREPWVPFSQLYQYRLDCKNEIVSSLEPVDT